MTDSYRQHFCAQGAGQAYDEGQYAHGSYWDLLWVIERSVLDRIVEQLVAGGRVGSYLDFACGTGRVLAHLEDRFDSAVGIDVSEEMLERARRRVRRARLLQTDITLGGVPEGRYHFITAFRFLLNAEPTLRVAALEALAKRLSDRESLLVVSAHGNPFSFKLLVQPMKWMRARLGGRPDENYLRSAEVHRLLAAAGLEVVERYGMGLLPWRLWKMMPRCVAPAVEGVLMKVPGLWRLGVNQIFVCRLSIR